MRSEDRIKYNKAINVITYKLIDSPEFERMPTNEQLEAIRVAVHAMNMMAYDLDRNLDREVAILNYHLAQPNALLFKDKNTMNALVQGVIAMKYIVEDADR